MKQIPLTQGQFAVVDDADYHWLNQFKWQVLKRADGRFSYAARTEYKPKKRTVYMHCCILDAPKVDHKDGNTLNNQRHNLRPATDTQNARNAGKRQGCSSGYKGVAYRTDNGKYRSYIRVDYKLINLGQFDSELDAAKAYDHAALQHFGHFARLNFSTGDGQNGNSGASTILQ